MRATNTVSMLALLSACLLLHPVRPVSSAPPAAVDVVQCFADCNGDGEVTVNEIIMLVNITLGNATVSSCPPLLDPPIIHDIIRAVSNALYGCPA